MQRSGAAVSLLFALLVAACGGSDGAKPDAAVDVDAVPIDAVSLRTVNGTVQIHLVAPSGVSDLKLDLSTYPVSALVGPDYTAIPGVGAPDSTFRIDGVPEGSYVVPASTAIPRLWPYLTTEVQYIGPDWP